MAKFTEKKGVTLDPDDWGTFREVAHNVLDRCIDRLSQIREFPWQPLPQNIDELYRIDGQNLNETEVAHRLVDDVLPYATGNTHPRFFGWVHGTGLATGILSEIVAATMNSNCGGRDHGMIYVERAVVDWCKRVFGFPDTASGLLVSGTSLATVVALSVARFAALGPSVRRSGLGDARLTAYAGTSAHSAVGKSLDIIGIGSNSLRLIPEAGGKIDLGELVSKIHLDRAEGFLPFAIVATCGSVDFGLFEDLGALADIAEQQGLWLHVDGAFGAWTKLAAQPWGALTDGIERADSIACDFHKWMFVQYDCGLVLIKDSELHRGAFSARPAYLKKQARGLGSGEPWPCDLGPELSRGSRALKVWTALQTYGAEKLGGAITANCEQALRMAALVEAEGRMSLLSPVVSNVCVFTADQHLPPKSQSTLNGWIAEELQVSGEVVLSTTSFKGVTYLRAAITNHRTTFNDIETAIQAVCSSRNRFKMITTIAELDK